MSAPIRPLVSINIPTYNSSARLVECLNAISAQIYNNIEVLIIDSHSKDATLEIARKYKARILNADSLALARKAGVEASLGKYIFLVDSDQIIDTNVVEACVDACEGQGYDGVTLFERSKVVNNTFAERVIAYDKWLFHSLRDDNPIHGTAIPRFFKAEFLKRIDFLKNPPITFEHSIIHNEIIKMGAKIKFVDAFIYHYETPAFQDVFKKFRRYGFFYIPALKTNKLLVVGHSLPRRSYFHVKALRSPFLLLGLFFLYFIKGIAAFSGIFLYLINKKHYKR